MLGVLAILAIVGDALLVVRTLRVRRPGSSKVERALHRPRTWLIGVPVVAIALLVGGPFLFVSVMSSRARPPLSFSDLKSPSAGAVTSGRAVRGHRYSCGHPDGHPDAADDGRAIDEHSILRDPRSDDDDPVGGANPGIGRGRRLGCRFVDRDVR